jgi:hypothetical protein
MMGRRLARLLRMDRAELMWRGSAGARIAADRIWTTVHRPRWDRRQLQPLLSGCAALDDVHRALRKEQWRDAHRALSRHFVSSPPRFPLSHGCRSSLAACVRRLFPESTANATARADRILAGEYDLLGYRALRFDRPESGRSDRAAGAPCLPGPPGRRGACDLHGQTPDWHLDPVHECRAPQRFWSTVDYLDPAWGDHKIIWELNRHQHWLALGRAYWLSDQSRYRDRFQAELASWLDANPPLTGINWASMLELALRSLSWLWALHFFVDDHVADDTGVRGEEPWTLDVLLGLDRQLTHIERNLSCYFSPNTHLLGEALALYVSGRAVPELAASRRREATGRRVLVAEMQRQINTDGGYCERSTHYHRYALDFYILALIVARLTQDPAADDFERTVSRLAAAARLLADDRGRLPPIGDDDGGSLFPITGRPPDDIRDTLALASVLVGRPDLAVGPSPEEALWMLGSGFPHPQSAIRYPQSSLRSAALPETGYYISRSSAGDHLVIDGGPHGYQNGGHAHADALSLTLTLGGQPLLIDPGTGCYTTDPAIRDRLRSSALHNTLTLDGRSQSVPSGPFHWSHAANGRVHRWRTHDQADYFDGSQDGYQPVEHRRRVLAMHSDLLVVSDYIDAAGRHAAAVHWHVHPDWDVAVQNRRVMLTRRDMPPAPAQRARSTGHSCEAVTLTVPAGVIETFRGDGASGLGWYSPAYGQLDPASTIRLTHTADGPFWMASVFDFSADNQIQDVEWLMVRSNACSLAHAAMLRITRAWSIDEVLWAEPSESGRRNSERGIPEGKPDDDAGPPATWRGGDIETDARMLFSRIDGSGRLTRLHLIDGSVMRDGKGRIHVALPQPAPVWNVDFLNSEYGIEPELSADRGSPCAG